MRISQRSKYALKAMVYLCQTQDAGKNVTVLSIAEKFSISKIFLEQVFALLRKAGLLKSTKGATGGYTLSRSCSAITVYEILRSTETALFENTELDESESLASSAITEIVCLALDKSIAESLSSITLQDLANESLKRADDYIYYL